VLGYVIAKPKRSSDEGPRELEIPPDLRRRLARWIDVEEVGRDGFWLWLRAVLPLLPDPDAPTSKSAGPNTTPDDRIRELATSLVDCARDRARLTVVAGQYVRDNQALVRRLKALEAALRTFERAGHAVEIPSDEAADAASERYLPRR
jgi:hypothetical protein